jgi:hypothetical protein
MSKILLSIEEDYDFILIGVSCHTKDYRLCWEINKSLNSDLKRTEDLEISKKGEVNFFSFYEYIDEDNYIEYYLISNLGSNGYLIPEQKKVDFFLLLKGNTSTNQAKDIIGRINSLSLVLTSFKIDPNQLKSKHNLLF